jgi:uncharacterized protein YyaL (SSP411 family)
MNQYFVNIKVDREERPDVDRVYMTFVQATTGHGGWPMSVFLTPDLKPFYGGTYFPPDDRYGRPGFVTLLKHVAKAWQDDRKGIEASGDEVIQVLQGHANVEASSTQVDWNAAFELCYRQFAAGYDARYGGFGDAPKFPRPATHDFMHRYGATNANEESGQMALQMSRHTLGAMSDGGMNDQLGGGFHRYSVDEQWIVSHFEKMLYDQAQLVISYIEMFQMTREPYFANTARNTLEYVLRDMTHPDGGFFSAEDADSLPTHTSTHKDEGAFYVWTVQELEQILGAENAAIFGYFYGVRPEGNAPAQGDPHGEFKGKSILYLARDITEVERRFGKPAQELVDIIAEARTKLFALREQRPRPHRDDKIIASWNGLMIGAFARTAQVLGEERFADAAGRAAAFIKRELWDDQTQTLRRHYKDGAADVPAFADDYAAMARGCIELFEATFEVEHLQWAVELLETLNRDFWDEEHGGYFNSAPDPRVLLRMKEDYDGAEPSANSVACEALLRLSRVLERDDLRDRAEATLQVFGERVSKIPQAMPQLLCAAMLAQTPPIHIVIAGERDAEDTKAMLATVQETFTPFKSLLVLDDSNREFFAQHLPFTAEMKPRDGQATAYVCRDFACQQPVTTIEALREQLH